MPRFQQLGGSMGKHDKKKGKKDAPWSQPKGMSTSTWAGATILAAAGVLGTIGFMGRDGEKEEAPVPAAGAVGDLPPRGPMLGEGGLGWKQNEIDALYLQMADKMEAVFKQAANENKEPVFIFGEDHVSAKGLLAMMMGMRIIGEKVKADPSIKAAVFMEQSEKELKMLRDMPGVSLASPVFRMGQIHDMAGKQNITVVGGEEPDMDAYNLRMMDPNITREEETHLRESKMDSRDDHRAAMVNAHPGTVNLITGGGTHIKGMLDRLPAEKFLIHPMKAPYLGPIDYSGHSPAFMERANTTYDPKVVDQLELASGKDRNTRTFPGGDTPYVAQEYQRMIDKATEAYQGRTR